MPSSFLLLASFNIRPEDGSITFLRKSVNSLNTPNNTSDYRTFLTLQSFNISMEFELIIESLITFTRGAGGGIEKDEM
jgi:hypothetical protein